jgi:hypothetical protein
MNERVLIQPSTVRHEIEQVLGSEVREFKHAEGYDLWRDMYLTRYCFELDGVWVDFALNSRDREMSVDRLRQHVIVPAVEVWNRAFVRQMGKVEAAA